MSDYMTNEGAAHLARTIRRHWRLRGYHGIEVWLEPIRGEGEQADDYLYQVRTNIGPDGYPPRAAVTRLAHAL
jgi:hypothetical protein